MEALPDAQELANRRNFIACLNSEHLWVQIGVLKRLQNVDGACNELWTRDCTRGMRMGVVFVTSGMWRDWIVRLYGLRLDVVTVWFTRTHRGLIPTDFIFFAQAILCSGGVRHIVRTALYSVYHLPFPSDRRRWGLKKKMREGKKEERMSLSTALRRFWKIRQRAKGTAFAPASTSTGQLHAIRAACSDPDDGATLVPALCMWILDPDLGVEGECGQRLTWPIRFDGGVTTVGGDVAHMQLIAMSSIWMNSDKVVNWGWGASVDISRVRGHCVLRLWRKRVVPIARLADISKMMQPVARSAFCAVSRALAAGLMRPSSAKPTNCFCGGRGRGRLTSRTWRRPRSWACSWSQAGPAADRYNVHSQRWPARDLRLRVCCRLFAATAGYDVLQSGEGIDS